MSANRGFTLVELLVVIAVMVLLIALLLPSMERAREAARVVICAANQQQLVMAVRVYQNDYQDDCYSPGTSCYGGPWQNFTNWKAGVQGFPGNTANQYTWFDHQYWFDPYVRLGYLEVPDRGDIACFQSPIRDPGARSFYSFAVDTAMSLTTVSGHPNGAIPGEEAASSTYPYFVRGGSCDGPLDFNLFSYAYHRRHEQPARALVTHCPVTYGVHDHGSNGTLGYGYYVGNHYMRYAYLGRPWDVSFEDLKQTWGGANVAMGDGHVEWVVPQLLKMPHSSGMAGGFDLTYAGGFKAAIVMWRNAASAVQVRPGEY
jgi:prepilin-type N-terminal cleavage/methylation domain-containing protein/prepilin-type processing-associated H-X9-DG protein